MIQQPAAAIVTASVSLPLSTPEYSGKGKTGGRKDGEVRAFTLDLESQGLEQPNMGPREQRAKSPLTSGTQFTWV